MFPTFENTNKVLIAPLNWGLGHSTRSIPIIKHFLSLKKEVVIASDGEALNLLKNEFPHLKSIKIHAYKVKYKSQKLLGIIIQNTPNVLSAILSEKQQLKKIVAIEKPDLIISDSRFGFRNKSIKSIIISHQLNIQCASKILSFFINKTNTHILNQFDECWIPDNENRLLSGNLSYNPKVKNKVFIGPLTRLVTLNKSKEIDILILLSGPEPARSVLEEQLIKKLNSRDNITLVRGANNLTPIKNVNPRWMVIERADSHYINTLLHNSSIVISRAGYTSIMDYYLLGISAILIPTPGQPEQEYLGEYLNNKFGFNVIAQNALSNLDSLL